MTRSMREADIPGKMIRAFANARLIPATRSGAKEMKADMEHLTLDNEGNGNDRLVLSPPKMGNPNFDALAADYFQVFRANYNEETEEYLFEHIAQVQGIDAPDRTESIIVQQCKPFLASCGETFLVVTDGSPLHQWIADRTTFDDEEGKNDEESDTSQTSEVRDTDENQTSDTSNRRTTDSGRHKTENSRRTKSPQGRNKETSKDDRKREPSSRRERERSRSPSRERGRRGDDRKEDSRPRRDGRDHRSKRNRSRSRSHSRDRDRDSQRNRGRSFEQQGRGRTSTREGNRSPRGEHRTPTDKGKDKTRIVVDGVETLEQRF